MRNRQINLFHGVRILFVAAVIWSLCSFYLAADETSKVVDYEYSGDTTTVDRKAGITTLKGNAKFRRSDGDYMNADEIIRYENVKPDNSREVIKIVAIGNVEMKEKGMVSTCEYATLYEKEDRIELKGSLDKPAVVDDGGNRMEAPFIIYFRAEDRIYASGLLFSVGLENKGSLDNGALSDSLRREFKNNKISLSDGAAVSKEESEDRWLITDGDKSYIVKKEEDKLDVLARDSVRGHVKVEVKESETVEAESAGKKTGK